MTDVILTPRKTEFGKEWEYELVEDFEIDHAGAHIVVPRFFSYDGASIPSIAWATIYTPFDPIVMAPALVHDWLYSNHQVDRKEADKLLKKMLRANGVPAFKAEVIYRAVEEFGKSAWENRPDDIKYLRWLKQKLIAAGLDVKKYAFPPEV